MTIHRLLPLAVLLLASAAAAHHPVGIPQYRDGEGGIVMIYNVLTEDYVVRLQALPGRPVCPPEAAVEISARITPRDPEVTYPGETWLSVVEEMGDGAEREVRPPSLESREAGERELGASISFGRPGEYAVRLEFTESPGVEILSFPLRVERSGGSPAAVASRIVVPVGIVIGVLLLARLAARRRATREESEASGG